MSGQYAAPDFWLHQCPDLTEENAKKEGRGMHVAFKAGSEKAVTEFWEAALFVYLSSSFLKVFIDHLHQIFYLFSDPKK